MRRVEHWVADDGTVFNSEKECRAYEMIPSTDVRNGLRLLDRDFEQILYHPTEYEPWTSFAGRIAYVNIISMTSLNWMKQLSDYTETPLPAKLGTFYIDDGSWVCIEDLLDELAKIRRKLTE